MSKLHISHLFRNVSDCLGRVSHGIATPPSHETWQYFVHSCVLPQIDGIMCRIWHIYKSSHLNLGFSLKRHYITGSQSPYPGLFWNFCAKFLTPRGAIFIIILGVWEVPPSPVWKKTKNDTKRDVFDTFLNGHIFLQLRKP